MKHMKKFFALLIAAMLVLAMAAPAMADSDVKKDTAFVGTADGSLTITNLEQGDKVEFYKVLAFDANATKSITDAAAMTTDGSDWGAASWKLVTPFTTGTGAAAITLDNFKAILNGAITPELAGKIAALASGTASYTVNSVPANGTATVLTVEDGLYVAIVTPQKAGVLYNPIFVASDYYKTGIDSVSSTWNLVDNGGSYSDKAVAKKTVIDVNKTAKDANTIDANDSETVSAGDIVTFTVTTTIPKYASNYKNPVFNVTDVLSTGLELDTNSIKVFKANVNGSVFTKDGSAMSQTTGDNKTFTIPTENLSTSGYKIVFDTEYIKALSAAQPIIIEYKAEVTSAAQTSVNIFDNTVTVNYSNKPDDETGAGTLKDETKHYTFDIDANLLGTESDTSPWKTVEVVKVGVDKDGKEITVEDVTWHQGAATQPKIGPLAGAKFELYKVQGDAKVKYTNKYINDNTKIVSDDTGRLTIENETYGIRGLDAGIYYLREVEAPAGYIRLQDDVKIEIRTVIEPVTKTVNGVTWTYDELKSYKILINDVETASYTMTNEKPDKGDTVVGSDGLIGATGSNANGKAAAGKIQNTQGVELPATGGAGTKVLITLGSLFAVAFAVVLVSRRRAEER